MNFYRKDDLISSLVYNIFIAPVYAIFAAFASLALLNAIIFLGNFSLCKMLIFLCPWMSPISLICKRYIFKIQIYNVMTF
jgi:hypothetical protein